MHSLKTILLFGLCALGWSSLLLDDFPFCAFMPGPLPSLSSFHRADFVEHCGVRRLHITSFAIIQTINMALDMGLPFQLVLELVHPFAGW